MHWAITAAWHCAHLCVWEYRETEGKVPGESGSPEWNAFALELLLEKPVQLLTFQTRFFLCSLLILINLASSDWQEQAARSFIAQKKVHYAITLCPWWIVIPVPRWLSFITALGSAILLVTSAHRSKKGRLNLEMDVIAGNSFCQWSWQTKQH